MSEQDGNHPGLTVSPQDQSLARLEAEIAELVAACLYDYLKQRGKESVAIDHDEPK